MNARNVSLVVAMSRNRVIGRDGHLPWHLPHDLKFFKRVTLGKPVLMGRKTFASIGRPLPGRVNIVLTGQRDYQADGCIIARSLDEALQVAEPLPEVMVIGGASLYRQFLERAARIYLTQVEADVQGDTWFPELAERDWQEVWQESHPPDARHAYSYRFSLLERRSPATDTPVPIATARKASTMTLHIIAYSLLITGALLELAWLSLDAPPAPVDMSAYVERHQLARWTLAQRLTP